MSFSAEVKKKAKTGGRGGEEGDTLLLIKDSQTKPHLPVVGIEYSLVYFEI